jgi:AcrR family transcriptional regulator
MSAKPDSALEPLELEAPLPRGRHGIPRELIVANQRQRLLAAAALQIAAHGYASLSVADIAGRAGVSRVTFYANFEDKLDCVLAAQAVVLARLRKLIAAAYEEQPSWAEGVAAATAAVLGFAAKAPHEANLVRISTATTGEPELARRGLDAVERLAAAMRERRGGRDSLALELREQAVIGGATAVIGAKLIAGEAASLPALREELVRLILAPYLGDEEAKSIAAAA